jgi:hypothetical protein
MIQSDVILPVFSPELRYMTFKLTDLAGLELQDLTTLHHLANKVARLRAEAGKKPLCALVVEKDWPEYQPTWAALAKRCLGEQDAICPKSD